MVALLVIAFVLWSAKRSSRAAWQVVADDHADHRKAHSRSIADAHPDWSARRVNRLARARAVGATSADLLHLGPAMGRALWRGWWEARDEWGTSREEHEEWRRNRFGELEGRRAARGGSRPAPLRSAGRRIWRWLLGPVPQVAFIRSPAPAQNVVPFPAPRRPALADGAGSAGSDPAASPGSRTPAQGNLGPGSPGPAAPAQTGPGSSEPGPGTPARPDPGPDPALTVDEPAPPDDPTPAPATAAEAGTDTAESSADTTDGGTTMAPTGETSTYEATNAALDSFADAAGETRSAAEGTAMPITDQSSAVLAASEQLSASLTSIGMKDDELLARVRKLGATAADLNAKAQEMDRLRLEVMELAMQLDDDARAAKDWHVEGQGKVREAIASTGGTAADANAYAGV